MGKIRKNVRQNQIWWENQFWNLWQDWFEWVFWLVSGQGTLQNKNFDYFWNSNSKHDSTEQLKETSTEQTVRLSDTNRKTNSLKKTLWKLQLIWIRKKLKNLDELKLHYLKLLKGLRKVWESFKQFTLRR